MKWTVENMFDNKAIEAKIDISDDFAEITLKDSSYSLGRVICSLCSVPAEHYAKISVDIEKSNPDTEIRIFEIYYSNGTEILRQYIDPKVDSLTPKGADSLSVAVLVRGFSQDKIRIGMPKVEIKEQYKPRKVKLAAISIPRSNPDGREWTFEDNLSQSLKKMDEIHAKEKCDLYLLTEIFYTLGVKQNSPADGFLKLNSPEIDRIRAKAKELGAYISFSFSEVDDNGYYYNSAPLIDREGNIVLNYHKAQITMKEYAKGVIPGDEIMTYDTDFGRIGMAICWDLFFNEYVNLVAEDGVELIINPSLGYHFDMNSMRARDVGAFVITAGASGKGTAIMSPENELVASGEETGCAIGEVDLAERFPVKWLSAPSSAVRRNVYKYESRPDLYKKYR